MISVIINSKLYSSRKRVQIQLLSLGVKRRFFHIFRKLAPFGTTFHRLGSDFSDMLRANDEFTFLEDLK